MSETPNYLDIIKQVFEHKRKQFLKAEEELKQSHSSHNPAPFGALAMLATQFYSEIRTTNDVLESALKFVFKQENDMDEMRKGFLDILHVIQFLTKQIDKTPDSQIIKELDNRLETLEKENIKKINRH